MFSLICALINGLVNNREAVDLRRHRAHYDVTVTRTWTLVWPLICAILCQWWEVWFYFCCCYFEQAEQTVDLTVILDIITLIWRPFSGIVQSAMKCAQRRDRVRNLFSSGSLQWRHDGRDGGPNPGVSIVYSTVCSRADQRKHQNSASLAFMRGIHRWPVNPPPK